MSVVIRKAELSDIPFILKGYQFVVRNDPLQTSQQLTADRIKEDVLCDQPKAFIDVAVCNGELAGYVIYSFVYFATFGQNIWITTMYVDPFTPRTGLLSISQRFMEHVSKKDGKKYGIFASIEKTNHAMQILLKRYGGKVFEKFYIVGGAME
jgi:hypothetical protein